jgi:hypothetical protein
MNPTLILCKFNSLNTTSRIQIALIRGHSVLRNREFEDRPCSPQRTRRNAEGKQVIYILHALCLRYSASSAVN